MFLDTQGHPWSRFGRPPIHMDILDIGNARGYIISQQYRRLGVHQVDRLADIATTRDWVADKLRQHGIMPTRQRIDIAHALFSRRAHLSAEQLLQAVNLQQGEASKATIYNTLNLFLDKGLIREVIVDPGRVFYDPNIEPHHHFYNVETGELIDIQASDLQFSGLPKAPEGTVTEHVEVIIRIRPTPQSSPMGV